MCSKQRSTSICDSPYIQRWVRIASHIHKLPLEYVCKRKIIVSAYLYTYMSHSYADGYKYWFGSWNSNDIIDSVHGCQLMYSYLPWSIIMCPCIWRIFIRTSLLMLRLNVPYSSSQAAILCHRRILRWQTLFKTTYLEITDTDCEQL